MIAFFRNHSNHNKYFTVYISLDCVLHSLKWASYRGSFNISECRSINFTVTVENNENFRQKSYVFFLFSVSGLKCYKCSREDNTDALQYCALNSSALGNNVNITPCSSDHTKCVISKTILGNGTVFSFIRKCAQDNQCLKSSCPGRNKNGKYDCTSCCGGDLCNNGTGPTPSPAPETTQSTPPVQSGSCRIPLISGLCMFGSFLVCFVVLK